MSVKVQLFGNSIHFAKKNYVSALSARSQMDDNKALKKFC